MLIKNFNTTLTRSAAALALGASVAACSDTTVGTRSFDEVKSFTVPNIGGSIATGLTLSLPDIPIAIDLAEQEAYADGDFDFVTSVRVREIVFTIAPDSADPLFDRIEDGNPDSFEFVSGLNISLSADVGGVLTTVAIADLPENDPQIASNATSLTMNVNSDENIRDLIEGEDVNLLVSVIGRIPPDNVKVDADIRFRVGIGFR